MLEPPLELNEVTGAVVGAALEVHRVLGPGFLESVYEEAMAIEFDLRNISYERQKPVGVTYKGRRVGEGKLDFLVQETVVVELKAAEKLLPIRQAQLMSHLKATGCKLGLLINFHEYLLKDGVRRVIFTAPIRS
jgi:GxxExxY protein